MIIATKQNIQLSINDKVINDKTKVLNIEIKTCKNCGNKKNL